MDIESLIKANSKLIYKISTYFYNVSKEDLYQAGCLGLIKAYYNYKKDGKCKFSSYAYDYIYGEMYALANNRILKVNKNILKLANLIEKTRYKLAQKYDRIPSNEEVATFLNIDITSLESAISYSDAVSLDNEDSSYLDVIADKCAMPMDDRLSLKEGMDVLSPLERKIIEGRYYLDLTQDEIAKRIGISQVKVSRYMKRSLTKMHDYLTM